MIVVPYDTVCFCNRRCSLFHRKGLLSFVSFSKLENKHFKDGSYINVDPEQCIPTWKVFAGDGAGILTLVITSGFQPPK